MYLTDYHCHSNASPDGRATISELAAAGIAAGLSELCITDHCECAGFHPSDKKNLPDGVDFYFRERVALQLAEARAVYGDRIKLLDGVEIAQGHEVREVYDKVLAENSFDFVIASLHNLRGLPDFYYIKDYVSAENCRELLRRYIGELYEVAVLPGFDILAHITYPLRYMHYKYGFDVSLSEYGAELSDIFKILIQKGCGIEINVSGLRARDDITFPGPAELALYRECGGEVITVGSDAHKAADIGFGVARGQEILSELGFEYFTVYENRKPKFVKLP